MPDAFDGNSGLNGRVVFGRDGMVYMSTGGNIGKVAQDPASLRGKILRLRDDGSVPPDNPFVGRAGYRPEIFSLGIATRWPSSSIPKREPYGTTKTVPTAATKSTSSCRAAITDGRS